MLIIQSDGNTMQCCWHIEYYILVGQQIVLDSTIVVDAGVVTGNKYYIHSLNATTAVIDEVT